jgi:hypothetical protein
MIDPFSPTVDKELQEFDLFKKEMDGQERNQPGKTLTPK